MLVICASSLIDFHFHQYPLLAVIVAIACQSRQRVIHLASPALADKRKRVFVGLSALGLTIGFWLMVQIADNRRSDLNEATSYSLLLDQGI